MASATSGRLIIARERALQAVRLRKQGMSYSKIGYQLGVSEQAACKMVRKAMSKIVTELSESVEEARALDLARCDKLIESHWTFATSGDPKSSVIIIRLMERRAALLGLDVPRHVKVEDDRETIDEQLDKLVARLKAANAGREIPVTVEIDCTGKSVGPTRRLAQLADPGGARLGQDEDGG